MVRQETGAGLQGLTAQQGLHTAHSSAPRLQQVLVTAHSSSHVALGDAGPTWGSQFLGTAWRDGLLQEMGQGHFQSLTAGQQWGAGLS